MSNYKRLTNNNSDGYDAEYDFCCGCQYFGEPCGCNSPHGTCDSYDRFLETYNRLSELEDKIENGTLGELPCKVGTTIYQIYKDCSNCSHFKETGWEYDCLCDFDSEESKTMFEFDGDTDCIYIVKETEFTYNHIKGFGEDRFLTKAEAEKKLEELKNE